MKNFMNLFFAVFLLIGYTVYGQQLVRATDVKMVAEAGTKIVMTGGISFIGTSNWINNGETYLYKTTATNPEGWLDSTATGVLDATSTGNVFFNGSLRQSFYGKTKFYDLTIRNTIGDTLLSSCEVRNLLHLDTGYVFTRTGYGNDSLLVSNPATTAIVSTSSYSKSWVNGRLSRTGNVTSPFYLFPIGKTDSLYAPVKLLKLNTTTNTWTAEYTYAPPFDRTNIFGPPIDHISKVEYWEITSNNQGTINDDAKLSLSWRGRSFVSANSVIRDSLLVVQYINRPPYTWDAPGSWVTGNAVGPDSLSGYVTSNAATNNYAYDERRFTLGSFSKYNALPVKLLYFTAIADDNKVRLNWEAANEQDTRTYLIEKSLTASNFTTLGTVICRQQTQSAYVDYDNAPSTGWNYYRLKIIEKSGSYFYSSIRPVKFDKGLEEVKIFPDPATEWLHIQLPSSYTNNVVLQLYSINGKLMSSMKPTINNVQLHVLPLAAGTYILHIIKKDGSKETYPFIKQ